MLSVSSLGLERRISKLRWWPELLKILNVIILTWDNSVEVMMMLQTMMITKRTPMMMMTMIKTVRRRRKVKEVTVSGEASLQWWIVIRIIRTCSCNYYKGWWWLILRVRTLLMFSAQGCVPDIRVYQEIRSLGQYFPIHSLGSRECIR